jgi:hypothetical protein
MSALRQTEADALQQTVSEVASCLTRCATRPARYVTLCFVNYPQVHSRCGKKLIGVAAGSPHHFSRTAPLTQSRNSPDKVATLPRGARGFAVLCEGRAAGLELGLKVMVKPYATALISILATIHASGLILIKIRSTHCDGNAVAQKQAR